MIIGWDLATRLCGWCAGEGDRIPTAGAFELFDRKELGPLGAEFQGNVMRIHRRFPATHWFIEWPLLTPHDALWTLQRLYGVSFLLFTLAEKLGVVAEGVDYDEAKREFGGKRTSTKDHMVFVARKMGVVLPETKDAGQEDAADATAVWKVGIRRVAKHHIQGLDQAIYSGRRVLL